MHNSSNKDLNRLNSMTKSIILSKRQLLNSYAAENVKTFKRTASLTAITSLALLMTACQTNSMTSMDMNTNDSSTLLAQSKVAKSSLLKALQTQRRSSYSYHANIIATNENHLEAIKNATPIQLSMSDDPNIHCENMHDEAYANLIERAESDNVSVENDKYETQRLAIKAAYIDCSDHQDEWDEANPSQYSSLYSIFEDEYSDEGVDIGAEEALYSDEYNSEDYDTDSNAAKTQIEPASIEDMLLISENSTYPSTDTDSENEYEPNALEAEMEAARVELLSAEENMAVARKEFLPNYDSSHTKLDLRKAQMLKAYLLDPLSITMEGVYRPLSGKLSVMPSLQYQTRNHTSIVNHFIYIDANGGAIYLWADTFAYLLSSYVDEEMGTSMHNKWIKLDLNDGSLPDNFVKDLISAHFSATDKMYESTDENDYRLLSTDQLLTSNPKPNSIHIPYLKDSEFIVEFSADEESYEDYVDIYLSELYESISQKYPDLIDPEKETDLESKTQYLDNDDTEYEGEYSDESEYREDTDYTQVPKYNDSIFDLFTSRKIAMILLELIGQETGEVVDINELYNKPYTEDLDSDEANPDINYAVIQLDLPENKWVYRDVYGISNNRIVWKLNQEQLSSDFEIDVLKGLKFEQLTRYSSANLSTPMFAALPKAASLPNSENTIDLRQYVKDIVTRYEDGEGAGLGKTIYKKF